MNHQLSNLSPLAPPSCSVLHGDCREVLKGKGPFDLVITSPPYNAGKDYDGYHDTIPESEYWELIQDVAELTFSECRGGAYAAWNVPLWWGKRPKKYRPDRFRATIESEGWEFRDEIIWVKGRNLEGAQCGGYAMNHPHTPSIRNPYEPILIFLKPGQPKAKYDLTIEEWAKETIGMWMIPPNGNDHPCSFPERLSDKIIQLYSDRGETVCDPFAGSGTVGRSASKLGRKFIGAEISPEYFAMCEGALAEQYLL